MAGELTSIKQNIIDLYQQINCIKNGDCCGGDSGGGENIYTADGVFGTNRQGTLTDTLEILANGGNILHTFNTSGDTWFVQNSAAGGFAIGLDKSDPIEARLQIKGKGSTYDTNLIVQKDSGDLLRYLQRDNGTSDRYINVASPGSDGLSTVRNGIYEEINADYSSTTEAFPTVNGKLLNFIGAYTGPTLKSKSAYWIDSNGYIEESLKLTASRTVLGNSHRSEGLHIFSSTTVSCDVIGTVTTANGIDTNSAIGLVSVAKEGLKNIAILVPEISNFGFGNKGNVVFGADDTSTNNSMLEVTGDIEAIGTSSNIILARADGTRVKLSVDNSNNLTAVLA